LGLLVNSSEKSSSWSSRNATELYGIDEWSSGYFGISPEGEIQVRAPTPDGEARVSLMEIVDGLQQRGLQMPVLLRLENLVDSRISTLNDSFASAIEASGVPAGRSSGIRPSPWSPEWSRCADFPRPQEPAIRWLLP
jgi:arginine decarboxylase